MAIPKVSITGIARSNYKFTCSWKKPGKWKNSRGTKEDLDHYVVMVIVNGKKVRSGNVSASKTASSITLSASDYYPNKSTPLMSVEFIVSAVYPDYERKYNQRTHKWGPWTQVLIAGPDARSSYYLDAPSVPKVTATPAESADQTTFSWSVAAKAKAIVADCYYQTQLTEDDAAPNWNVAISTKSTPGSITITDSLDQTKSYTRWVRLQARGSHGTSSWSTPAKRIYARPWAAKIDSSSKASIKETNTIIAMKWEQPTSSARPCTSMQPEYLIGTPSNANLDPPSGSFTAFGKAYTKDNSVTSEVITDKPETDECLWVHVRSTYLNRDTLSHSMVLLKGKLTTPDIDEVVKNDANHSVTITATNGSAVPGAVMKAYYRAGSNMKTAKYIGVVNNNTATTLACPNWASESSFRIDVVAEHAKGMKSDAATWSSGSIPKAPTNVAVEQADYSGMVSVTWTNSWTDAQEIEISWADNVLDWESNKEPDSCRTNSANARWYVSGLETGKTWYFRARLIKITSGDETAGPWSNITEASTIDLSSAPMIPSLTLSKTSVYRDETFNASWGYVSTDGTAQAGASICEATINGSTITYGKILETTISEQSVTMYPRKYGWAQGTTHYLCVRVTSGSGRASDEWSPPVAIYVSAVQPAVIASTSLETITIGTGEEERQVLSLTEMPLSVTITGAGTGGITRLVVERVGSYEATRPNGTKLASPDGETICIWEQTGEAAISVTVDDLVGRLDDGASYKLLATVADSYGKSNTTESEVFEVHWSHQAVTPTATVSITDDAAAYITVAEPAPADYEEGDYIDIYRLSADAPELIVSHGEFGETYVDPYPAFGEYGGHRAVYVTANGDYITADESYAWVDLDEADGDYVGLETTIIDFGGARLILDYNLELSSSWSKDVQITKYLGGSVQGDWNPAVTRTGSVSGVIVTLEDPMQISNMRALADYAGICHVRTPDGSSYSADVQVSEDRTHENGGKITEFSLNISKVDQESLDGMTLAEWDTEESDGLE